MDLPEAQKEFLALVNKINDVSISTRFHNWIKTNWLYESTNDSMVEEDDEVLLFQIAAELRERLPLNAQLPSETIIYPKTGKNGDCDPSTTIHVDAFLYDDDLVDELCDQEKLPRNYCVSCGSKNTKPLTYISHSASKENLGRIFKELLPPLDGKILLDIGSRLGAVLYGAYVFSTAQKIIGIELNQDMVSLSSEMVNKYGMKTRVEVMGGDVRNYPLIVSSSDVIVMHNVFEFFVPPDVQEELWLFLRRTIKTGALLVTMPPLEESLSTLNVDIDLIEWVEEIGSCAPTDTGDRDDDSDIDLAAAGTASVPETDFVKLYRIR